MTREKFLAKMANEYTSHRFTQPVFHEVLSQGLFMIRHDRKRFNFYFTFYNNYEHGKISTAEQVAQIAAQFHPKAKAKG